MKARLAKDAAGAGPTRRSARDGTRVVGRNAGAQDIKVPDVAPPLAAEPPAPTEREPRAPGSRIGFLVHDVSRMRSTLYDQAVRPLNLTRSQWWVLGQLSRQRAPRGILQTELARLLDVGKVTIGGLVDRLEERGFVERRPDLEDRRAKRVVVTPAGREVLKQMVRLSEELNATIFAGFSEAEMRLAESVLARMKDNIREALEER